MPYFLQLIFRDMFFLSWQICLSAHNKAFAHRQWMMPFLSFVIMKAWVDSYVIAEGPLRLVAKFLPDRKQARLCLFFVTMTVMSLHAGGICLSFCCPLCCLQFGSSWSQTVHRWTFDLSLTEGRNKTALELRSVISSFSTDRWYQLVHTKCRLPKRHVL